MEQKAEEKKWYALRVTYNRELIVKARFNNLGIETFIPMSYKEAVVKEKRVRMLMPSIHNLIFVKIELSVMKEIKSSTDLPIRYIMDRESNSPIVIPEVQMKNFIAVSSTNDENLIYLPVEEVKLKKGDKVRIVGGIFAGCEGVLMRIRGDRRVVVTIPGIMAVATAFIHPSLLVKIDSKID